MSSPYSAGVYYQPPRYARMIAKYDRALLAISAGILGVRDQPDLVAFGPLHTSETSGVLKITRDAFLGTPFEKTGDAHPVHAARL